MNLQHLSTLPAILLVSLALPATTLAGGTKIWATPHDSYSSSVGVLGCKINVDRVAYWPGSVDCDKICVRLTHPESGRSVHLLRIDQSGGAHDVSYDAWNYLVTGRGAREAPTAGGAVAMFYEDVDVSECADLIHTGRGRRIPLSASNSMNFLASCLSSQPGSYVAKHHALYNILDSICTLGNDEECSLDDFPSQNQPQCPSTLGVPSALTSCPVWNVRYPTGEETLAGTPPSNGLVPGPGIPSAASSRWRQLRSRGRMVDMWHAGWEAIVVPAVAGLVAGPPLRVR